MYGRLAVLLAVCFTLCVPAFVGAEGFGAQSVGGRGGQVLFVTNLNDSGPGSLREAIEADGPRTVIFRVSGTVALKSSLVVKKPYITIAGQTAPGDGICLMNHALVIAADQVIVRYLRCRPGDNAGAESDALSVSSGRNIIVDHCSASWSVDETLSASTGGQLGNVTVQWCIISESLHDSVHHKGPHGYGSLIRGGWGNGYTYHRNLYAHHHARLPRPGTGYNADGSNGTNSITRMNFVGNYYKAGANSRGNLAFSESTRSAQAYFHGNAMNGSYPREPWLLVSFSKFSPRDIAAYVQSEPIGVPPVATDDAMTAFERVLAGAGAVLPERDAVDARIVNEVRTGAGRIIDDEAQVGGWPELKSAEAPADRDGDGMPDDWEKRNGFDAGNPVDRNGDADADGYTNLEEYLNGTKP
ncbi:MAG: pectate lyase family protein [Planctomycetota bacterium]|jgi:pectate lyase